jgi:uncharacterized peroxidase-related enzyme
MAYLEQTKNTENFLEVLVRDPKRYLPIMRYLDNLTQQESELTWKERELISLEVSKSNGAEFCAAIHKGVLNSFDESHLQVRQERIEPVLKFVRKLSTDSKNVSENDINGLRAKGWNDQTIEDVIGLTSAITVYDILANGFGFKATLPETVFEEMGKGTIDAGGFEAQFNSFIQ